MSELFGQKVVSDLNSPRYFVWFTLKLARFPVVAGFVSVLIMMILSFSNIAMFLVFICYVVALVVLRLYLVSQANAANATVNQMVSKGAYEPETIDEFSVDIREDKDYIKLTAIIVVWAQACFIFSIIVMMIILTLTLFTDLPAIVNAFLLLLPCNYLVIEMTKYAEAIAQDDFDVSLTGAMNKLFQMDTIRRG
ncbi:hypothetical protein A9Q91_06025 [Candidatus Gracilibacteria bacterium 28_42_T64]|nr:hypothetical protein A9Q91_06025 [Candidatus Gracilibacteria bacterium 28_42_T64]